MFKDPMKKLHHEVVTISFTDDMDLVSNRENGVNKMQQILNQYNNLYAATRECIEEDKTAYFSL